MQSSGFTKVENYHEYFFTLIVSIMSGKIIRDKRT